MNWTQDVRYGSRIFTRAPAPAVVIVLSLALAIGANTAVFSFVNAIQFKPLPFADEDRLVDISETSPTELCAGCSVGASYPVFLDWRTHAQSFAAIGAYYETRFVLSTASEDGALGAGDPEPQRVGGAAVSGDFFRLLGDLRSDCVRRQPAAA